MKVKYSNIGEIAQAILVKAGIKKGDNILDFGCGTGTYSIPAAKIIGEDGKIFSVETDITAIKILNENIHIEDLANIEIVHTDGDIQILFQNDFFDFILLFDVLHHYYFTDSERENLLREIVRVSKPDAIISVYPEHMNADNLIIEMRTIGLKLIEKISGELIHYHEIERGTILNFCKHN